MDSIEKQVKGYCDKTKIALNPNKSYPWQGVESDPKQGVANTPTEQEKEKEEEKEEYIYTKKQFLKDWNNTRTEVLNKPSHLNRLDYESNNILEEIIKDVDNLEIEMVNALKGFFKQQTFPEGQDYTTNTKHFLNHFSKYAQAYYDKNANIYGKC